MREHWFRKVNNLLTVRIIQSRHMNTRASYFCFMDFITSHTLYEHTRAIFKRFCWKCTILFQLTKLIMIYSHWDCLVNYMLKKFPENDIKKIVDNYQRHFLYNFFWSSLHFFNSVSKWEILNERSYYNFTANVPVARQLSIIVIC